MLNFIKKIFGFGKATEQAAGPEQAAPGELLNEQASDGLPEDETPSEPIDLGTVTLTPVREPLNADVAAPQHVDVQQQPVDHSPQKPGDLLNEQQSDGLPEEDASARIDAAQQAAPQESQPLSDGSQQTATPRISLSQAVDPVPQSNQSAEHDNRPAQQPGSLLAEQEADASPGESDSIGIVPSDVIPPLPPLSRPTSTRSHGQRALPSPGSLMNEQTEDESFHGWARQTQGAAFIAGPPEEAAAAAEEAAGVAGGAAAGAFAGGLGAGAGFAAAQEGAKLLGDLVGSAHTKGSIAQYLPGGGGGGGGNDSSVSQAMLSALNRIAAIRSRM